MKKTIVFSLLCHENLECIKDLILNIKYFSKDFNSYILIVSKNCINDLFNDYNYDETIRIVNVRDDKNIWGTIDIFHYNMINAKYLFDNNIDFDYFWFLSSNEYFIKDITIDFLNENIIKLLNNRHIDDNEYNLYFNNFINTSQEWHWFDFMKNDNYSINFFKDHKLYFEHNYHESTVFDKIIIKEAMELYLNSNIQGNSTFRDYCMEEIFVKSYIYSKYITTEFKNFCHVFTQDLDSINKYNNGDWLELYNNFMNEPLTLSIKPVYRNYNDPLRKFIREKCNDNKINFYLNENLNKHELYYSKNNNSTLYINDDYIELIKKNRINCDYVWVGYNNIFKGRYILKFNILPNKDINNFSFIKTHNPVRFHKINKYISTDEWNSLEIIIEIESDWDHLCLIFDDYNDFINIKFNNINICKLNNETVYFYLDNKIINNNEFYLSYNNNSLLYIDNDIINLNKINKNICDFSWIGYNINGIGKYILTFYILSDKDINNFNFIKTHNPAKYYNINKYISINEWNNIEVIFDIESDWDHLCLIFDNYNGFINLKFKNININKIN